MRWIVLIAIGAWFLFGNPAKTFANWLWSDSAAPWETVDAFYYPNRSDLGDFLSQRGLGSLQECRDWVYSVAASRRDPNLTRGDYECGIGRVDDLNGIAIYRLSAS